MLLLVMFLDIIVQMVLKYKEHPQVLVLRLDSLVALNPVVNVSKVINCMEVHSG